MEIQPQSKSSILQLGSQFSSNNWLDLGKIIGGQTKPKRFKMTEAQVRFVLLALLYRNSLGIK